MNTTATLGLNWTSLAWLQMRRTSSATDKHSKEATSPSAQRGAKSAGQRRSKEYSTSRFSAQRVSGVADAAGRADARVERGGDPGLPGRLLSRRLERHLARGHAARGQAVEQPRPRRLGEGERLPVTY